MFFSVFQFLREQTKVILAQTRTKSEIIVKYDY